ncbi:MAG: glycosyltransferase [Planctomycetota bacterium]
MPMKPESGLADLGKLSNLRLLFVGESWRGSCARSLREAISRRPDVVLDEVDEDHWFTKPRSLWLRAVNRLTAGAFQGEFREQVFARVREFRPQVFMTYKGTLTDASSLAALKALGLVTVNVYPDCSPHSSGDSHQKAVGEYDLVISTKPFHKSRWKEVYGYDNRCEFVPQGYDPSLHLVEGPAPESDFDVVMVATWREEYAKLMQDFARNLGIDDLKVAIGGTGWAAHSGSFPRHWVFPGGLHGPTYVDWLRKGRICIAPLTRSVVFKGRQQPGDEDSTRTYELAAARCFFIHRRTDYVKSIFDEVTEVPMFGDSEELALLVRRFLDQPAERAKMAAAAQRRAVPAYSLDMRAAQVLDILRKFLLGQASR